MFDGRWHPVFDERLLELIVEGTPEVVGVLLTILTHVGSVYVVVPTLVLFYFWAPQRTVTWIAAVCGYYGLMGAIKSLNSAQRPALDPPVSGDWFPGVFSWLHAHGAGIDTTSFPSGNAMVATTIITLMIVDLRISSLRNRAMVGVAVIAVVGYSRLALAVHYPIDVFAGIVLGVLLAVMTVLLRDRVGVIGVFGTMAILAAIGVWLRSNGFGVPSWEELLGSNRNLALGGALGGLLMWWWGTTTDWRPAGDDIHPWTVPVGLFAVVVVSVMIHTTVAHPLAEILLAAVITGVLIALPFVWPDRDTIQQTLDISSGSEPE